MELFVAGGYVYMCRNKLPTFQVHTMWAAHPRTSPRSWKMLDRGNRLRWRQKLPTMQEV